MPDNTEPRSNPPQSEASSSHASAANGKVTDILQPEDFRELVFGLVGPLGADYSGLVADGLRRELEALGYSVHGIRLSRLIERLVGKDYSSKAEDERIDGLMNEGTFIRALLVRAALHDVNRRGGSSRE